MALFDREVAPDERKRLGMNHEDERVLGWRALSMWSSASSDEELAFEKRDCQAVRRNLESIGVQATIMPTLSSTILVERC